MIFDLYYLPNSNQAVIASDRKPKNGERYMFLSQANGWNIDLESTMFYDSDFYAITIVPIKTILASREPIPGVYLLPEWVWDKRVIAFNNAFKGEPMDPNEYFLAKRNFDRGYEAAGGYTREDVQLFPKWLRKNGYVFFLDGIISGYQKPTVSLDIIPEEEILNEYEEYLQTQRQPRQLDITLNEDGSLPVDEKGVVKVNNVIY